MSWWEKSSTVCNNWATSACSLLEQGHSEALVSAIAALPPIAPEPGQARSLPERAVDYFTTNADRMRYPLFRAQGMHEYAA